MNEKSGEKWTRDELLLAINLYCRTPFGRIHVRNPEVVELSQILGRTPGSVSYKLANFASIDPSLERTGATNVSRLDREVCNEFFENWDETIIESEDKLAEVRGAAAEIDEAVSLPAGVSVESVGTRRISQQFFRKMVLSSYDSACCITGLPIPELLIASHIVPLALDIENRTNPRNGLCLNALHDRAFDAGLITIDASFRVVTSSRVRSVESGKAEFIAGSEGAKIRMPSRFLPSQDLLDFHRTQVFVP